MQFFRRKLNKKGFTLIELIVVIAILAILALIAIPRLTGFKDDAQTSADMASAATIYKAASSYYAAHGDLSGFDPTLYVENEVTYSGGVVSGNGITPVTVNGQTFPES